MIKQHPSASLFLNLSGIPNYTRIIQDPIDLTILEKRLAAGNYTTFEEFAVAAKTIWSNTQRFAQPGTQLYNANLEVCAYFEDLMEKTGGQQTSKASRGNKGRRGDNRKGITDRPLSSKEKAALKHNIMRLSPDKLQGVARIIQPAVDTGKNKDTLEFDIDKLPTSVARELDKYVKDNIEGDKKGTKKKKETPRIGVTLFLTS